MEEKKWAFCIYYNDKGEEISWGARDGCVGDELTEGLDYTTNPDGGIVLNRDSNKLQRFFEEPIHRDKSVIIKAAHGSPGCIIYIGGKKYCICCS